MRLYEKLPCSIIYKGKKYKLNPSFNRVLFCLETLDNKEYSDEEKAYLCFHALIKNKIITLSSYEKYELLNNIFKLLFEKNKNNSNNKKSFDFVQDSKYIYAGFMQCYGIDLFDLRNKLHWWKFIALFNGLSNNTRIMQIIDIRLRPIPQRTKYNGEEISNLLKQKAEYALETTQEEREKEFAQCINSLFDSLEKIAEKR